MTDLDLYSTDLEVFEAALKRLSAEREGIDEHEQADKLEAATDMQDAVRQSGARQIDSFSFATNEGTVVLASPADMARMAMFDRMRIDRRRPWAQPGYLGADQHAIPGRRK